MKKVAKRYLIFAFLSAFFLLYAVPIAATDGAVSADVLTEAEAITDELEAFRAAVPPEVADLLPADFFSEDVTQMGDAVAQASSTQTLLAVVGKMTGLAMGEHLAALARICGLLLISAVFRMLTRGGGLGEGTGRALTLCSVAALTVSLFATQRTAFEEIALYFKGLETLAVSFLPLMGSLYAMGGNVGAAVVNHGVMSAFLSILETVVGGSALPVAGVCLALAIPDAVAGSTQLRALSGLIKRSYTLFFSFLMLLLCGVLGIQTTLAKGSDTLALRTVRFAAGSFLPVVGGSVSEALRTVSG